MFIQEQVAEFREVRKELQNEEEWIERLVWSPVARRHCMWVFEGLVKTDERGKIVRGSRRRWSFPPWR